MNYRKNLRLDYLKLGLMLHQVLVNPKSLPQTLLKNKDLGVGVGLQLQDQSIRDAFMVLETLLILTNAEMTASCSIRKDLPVVLKMLQRLTARGKSCINQKRICAFFSQQSFSSYLQRHRTLFITNNNLTNSISTSSNTSRTRQMTNRGTLLMTILTTNLAAQNYY